MSGTVKQMCDRLVDERISDMLATPEARAKLAAYLDGLDGSHAGDTAMRAYVRQQRKRLAEREAAGS